MGWPPTKRRPGTAAAVPVPATFGGAAAVTPILEARDLTKQYQLASETVDDSGDDSGSESGEGSDD